MSTSGRGIVHQARPIWCPPLPAKLPLKRLLPTKLLLTKIAHKFHQTTTLLKKKLTSSFAFSPGWCCWWSRASFSWCWRAWQKDMMCPQAPSWPDLTCLACSRRSSRISCFGRESREDARLDNASTRPAGNLQLGIWRFRWTLSVWQKEVLVWVISLRNCKISDSSEFSQISSKWWKVWNRTGVISKHGNSGRHVTCSFPPSRVCPVTSKWCELCPG